MNFKENFYADVRVEKRFTTAIFFRNANLEECKETTTSRAFLRVFDGEMWYYASTYKTDDLQGELDKLYAVATPNPDIGAHPVVRRFQANRAENCRFRENSVKNIPLSEKRSYLAGKIPALNSSDYVKMTVARYSDIYVERTFLSSKGADIGYDFQLCGSVFAVALADEKDNFTNQLIETKDFFSELSEGGERIREMVSEGENYLLHAKAVVPGRYPVVLSPEVAGVFAHESFGHKSEADFMLGDATMKEEWQIGKKVGADLLSIYDSGLESGSGYCPFDDEGTRAGKTYLIRNGVLTGRLHSAATAADLNEEITGNARALNCEFEPIVRMTSTVIEAGTQTKEELFSGIKHGYFIKSYKHGSGMSTFTIAPNLAYEIVDGKISEPVKIAVITGNVFETLNRIDGLSDKAEIISNIFGGCGKMEQSPLPVSFGGPFVSVSEMNVQ